jgi:hypothetical protein
VSTTHIFVGPSVGRREIVAYCPSAVVHPPIRHGDTLRLNAEAGDTILILDGLFHHSAPIRHKEILHQLDRGVTVVGASSMGALRAAELTDFGMVGVGAVFALFRNGVLLGDDEVAVAHSLDGDYKPINHPLVNIRALVDHLVTSGDLSRTQADQIVHIAQSMPYIERTWRELARRTIGGDLEPSIQAAIRCLESNPEVGDLKLHDARKALEFVNALSPAKLGDRDKGLKATDRWRTGRLWEWRATFQSTIVPALQIPDASIMHYVQLYDNHFPARWNRLVLQTIAGVPDSAESTDSLAIAAATAAGITIDALDGAQLRYWLTAEEMSAHPRKQLTRLLVRSSRLVPMLLVAAGWASRLLPDTAVVVRDVAEASRRNNSFATKELFYSKLKATAVRQHLCVSWSCAEPELDAAARDRGFASVSHAVAAAKPFFLSRTNLPLP